MELLKIHSNGQWELVKQYSPRHTDGGIETRRVRNEPGNDFRAYRSTTGQLREDHGQKGSVHGNPGNKRADRKSVV